MPRLSIMEATILITFTVISLFNQASCKSGNSTVISNGTSVNPPPSARHYLWHTEKPAPIKYYQHYEQYQRPYFQGSGGYPNHQNDLYNQNHGHRPNNDPWKWSNYVNKGRGFVRVVNTRAELHCNLGNDIVSNIIWKKTRGVRKPTFHHGYYPRHSFTKLPPRIRTYGTPGGSILIINYIKPQDYGTYMCIGAQVPNLGQRYSKNAFQTVEFNSRMF